jgi:hypothetical protein
MCGWTLNKIAFLQARQKQSNCRTVHNKCAGPQFTVDFLGKAFHTAACLSAHPPVCLSSLDKSQLIKLEWVVWNNLGTRHGQQADMAVLAPDDFQMIELGFFYVSQENIF